MPPWHDGSARVQSTLKISIGNSIRLTETTIPLDLLVQPSVFFYIYKYIYFFLQILEDTARYAGLLLARPEGFGLRPRPFLPFVQKKSLLCFFGPFSEICGVH